MAQLRAVTSPKYENGAYKREEPARARARNFHCLEITNYENGAHKREEPGQGDDNFVDGLAIPNYENGAYKREEPVRARARNVHCLIIITIYLRSVKRFNFTDLRALLSYRAEGEVTHSSRGR